MFLDRFSNCKEPILQKSSAEAFKPYIASLKKLIIIIPVFNESANIKILLETIAKNIPQANLLFVDDNSKDDTIKEIKTYSKKIRGTVNILNRSKKLGLGSAYIAAFKASLKKNYDFFLQMDADLSHNPAYILEMLKMLAQYDFIIGSRYVKGGGIFGWSWIRKFISYSGNLYARVINVKNQGFNWRLQFME